MNSHYYCCCDIGGTKILLTVIDEQAQVLFRQSFATPKPARPEAVVKTVKEKLDAALLRLATKKSGCLKQAAVCIAGFTEAVSGVVHQAPNIGWPQPVPLKQMLEQRLLVPVLLENDASAAVVGEVFFGAAKGHLNVAYVTISTGIGAGLFLNGRLYRGSFGFAGEIGHFKPFGRGRQCQCGGYDCLEAWASGRAIALSAKNFIDLENFDPEQNMPDTKAVFTAKNEGNVLAATVLDDAAFKAGTGLANLVNLLNPSCLVIGGAVTGRQPAYFEQIKKVVLKQAIRPATKIASLAVVPAALEPEAGIWGMYALATGRAEGEPWTA